MMKTRKLFLALISILMLLGQSPWEGAATTAPDGELPAKGMFVATNSFPINTVVDITNIETGKSTRTIVAKGIDNPGLLAVVSREAADLIGMKSGSISRLRMVQPSDPIAYLRFIEGQAAGSPAYDSGNVITEGTYREESKSEAAAAAFAPEPAKSGVSGPSYVLEEEWRNERIVTIKGYNEPEDEEPAVEIAKEEYDYITEEPYEIEYYEEYEEEGEYIAEEIEEEIIEEEPEYIAEEPYEEECFEYYEEELEYIVEEIAEEEVEYIAEEEEIIEEEPEYIAEEPAEIEEEVEYIVEYELVPAEERPPEEIYGIDPNDIIPEIVTAEPITPEPEPVRPSVVDTSTFSVPRVTQLDRGFYYVQLAAFDKPDLVETTLSDIDRSYKPVIYKDGDTWYRILLGPMNQGESAAVLARFKSIGYKDAFVRHAK